MEKPLCCTPLTHAQNLVVTVRRLIDLPARERSTTVAWVVVAQALCDAIDHLSDGTESVPATRPTFRFTSPPPTRKLDDAVARLEAAIKQLIIDHREA